MPAKVLTEKMAVITTQPDAPFNESVKFLRHVSALKAQGLLKGDLHHVVLCDDEMMFPGVGMTGADYEVFRVTPGVDVFLPIIHHVGSIETDGSFADVSPNPEIDTACIGMFERMQTLHPDALFEGALYGLPGGTLAVVKSEIVNLLRVPE